jgi:O-antigen ligase
LPLDLTIALASLNGIAALPVVVRLVRGRLTRSQANATILWGLPLLVIESGALYGSAPDRWLHALTWLLLVAFACMTGIRVGASARFRKQFLWTLLGIGMMSAMAGILGLGQVQEYERVTALGTNTIGAARAALLVPLIGFTFLWRYSLLRPLLPILTLPALLVAVSTGARGPILMAILAAAIMWLVTATARSFVIAALGGATTVLLVLFVPLPEMLFERVPDAAQQRLMGGFDIMRAILTGGNPDFGASERARLVTWKLAVDQFREHPLLGAGTAGYTETAYRFSSLWEINHPHNLVLQILADYGLFGMLLFGIVLATALRQAIGRHADGSSLAIAILFVFMFLGAMVSNSLIDNRMLWGLLLMVLVLPRRAHHVFPSVRASTQLNAITASASSRGRARRTLSMLNSTSAAVMGIASRYPRGHTSSGD